MAWTFTDLKYGWKIAAGITLAATTIYVASNTRERVNQADIIELALGTYERCLATQYSTNPVSYYVAPPSFVRSWYSNSYETTNVPGDLVTNWYAVLHTNAFTNVIGWRTDRAMMVELDAKIKALVPYYCNTDTVYDGSTNIVMLTVTGLWASLGIGDGTNQFTSVPASGTNAATYGAYPWRIYKTDLEERYKVLNALDCVKLPSAFETEYSAREVQTFFNDGGPHRPWDNFKLFCETAFPLVSADGEWHYLDYDCNVITSGWESGWVWQYTGGAGIVGVERYFAGTSPDGKTNLFIGGAQTLRLKVTGPKALSTNLATIKSFCQQYIKEEAMSRLVDYGVTVPIVTNVYHSYCTSDAIYTNASERTIKQWSSNNVFLIDFPTLEYQTSTNMVGAGRDLYGTTYSFQNSDSYVFPDFQYCTHKYW